MRLTFFLRFPATILCSALLSVLATMAAAQTAESPLPASEAFRLSAETVDGSNRLHWEIEEGYYLYRENFSAEGPDGEIPLETAPGVIKDDPTFGTVEVYYDEAVASMPVAAGPVTVTWQGCQDQGICYPPQTATITPTPASADEGDGSPGTGAFEAADAPADGGGITLASSEGGIGSLAAQGGAGLVVLGFFGLGLLLAFTPCVFPMFPIVAGMITGQGRTLTAGRGLALTGAYVSAMAAAFGLLGVAAAWSGQNLQLILQSPWAVGAVAALFVALAASMFGLYDIALPSALTSRVQRLGDRGGSFGGAAGLGFTSALIVGPCVTAPLAGALLYIARTGDVALGAAALFALGLGQGVPLLAIGAFGAHVLPRSGAWMAYAKRAFGVVFLGLAIWMIGRIVPGPAVLALWAVLLIATGVFLGGLDRLAPDAGSARRTATAVGVLALLGGGLQAVGAASGANDPLRPLAALGGGGDSGGDAHAAFTRVIDPGGLATALDDAAGAPSMIYVTAEWCTSCRVIERHALADGDVQAALDDLSAIEVDVTEFGADSQSILDTLGAVGPPTMVFLDASRRELPGTRLVGEVGPSDMIDSLTEAIR